jgi:hypothetical protein
MGHTDKGHAGVMPSSFAPRVVVTGEWARGGNDRSSTAPHGPIDDGGAATARRRSETPSISCVIPCRNEAENLIRLLPLGRLAGAHAERPALLPQAAAVPLDHGRLDECVRAAGLPGCRAAGLPGCRAAGLLAAWLRAARSGDLLTCHPGLSIGVADAIGPSCAAEYSVLRSPAFGELLRDQAVRLEPMSRILARGPLPP